MRLSARNQLSATVTSISRGASIAIVELDVRRRARCLLDHHRGSR